MLAFCSLSLGFASMPDLGEVHYDLSFGDDPLQTLDLYKTSAAAEGMPPVPCIMFVHGGGWSGGDKRTNENPPEWLLSLRQRGYHVASTNYRLAPAHRNPAQIDDVERCAPLCPPFVARIKFRMRSLLDSFLLPHPTYYLSSPAQCRDVPQGACSDAQPGPA